jgi:hypothetical protein
VTCPSSGRATFSVPSVCSARRYGLRKTSCPHHTSSISGNYRSGSLSTPPPPTPPPQSEVCMVLPDLQNQDGPFHFHLNRNIYFQKSTCHTSLPNILDTFPIRNYDFLFTVVQNRNISFLIRNLPDLSSGFH